MMGKAEGDILAGRAVILSLRGSWGCLSGELEGQ